MKLDLQKFMMCKITSIGTVINYYDKILHSEYK